MPDPSLPLKLFLGAYSALVVVHVLAGAIGLLVFWLPMFYRKGGREHKRSGGVFARAMYAVGFTGLALSLVLLIYPDPVRLPGIGTGDPRYEELAAAARRLGLFLNLLAFIMLAGLRHAIAVLRVKEDRRPLRRFGPVALYLFVFCYSLAVAYVGYRSGDRLMMIFPAIGIVDASRALFYTFKPTLREREWWIEHLSTIIRTGIAAHTAFFVFGAKRLLGPLLSQQWRLVLWLAPVVIGLTAVHMLSFHYRRKLARPAVTAAQDA